MINIFKKLKKRKEEKERLKEEEKQELLALKLKIFSLEWKCDYLKEDISSTDLFLFELKEEIEKLKKN